MAFREVRAYLTTGPRPSTKAPSPPTCPPGPRAFYDGGDLPRIREQATGRAVEVPSAVSQVAREEVHPAEIPGKIE